MHKFGGVDIAAAAAVDGAALPAGQRLVTLAERPDLIDQASAVNAAPWPAFMHEDPIANRVWRHSTDDFPEFQLVLLDEGDRIAATSYALPLTWDGTVDGLPDGWDDQVERSVADLQAARTPNTLGAMVIVIAPDRQGTGLSSLMLAAMLANARLHGHRAVIACVRPTLKERYPLMSIDDYAAWTRPDGLPFDPWLRVHVRAGGRIVLTSPRSMTMTGTVADWREWTDLEFPVGGPYVVPGALQPVEIDLVRDEGTYHDPNVWVVHEL